MGKIYCFINSRNADWCNVVAMSEDGYQLAGHQSTSVGWARHDIGINSDWQHEKYESHYPDGYKLIWLDDPLANEAFVKVLVLAEELSSYQS